MEDRPHTKMENIVLSLTVVIHGLLFGIETSTISGVLIQLRDVFELDHMLQQGVVTITLAGAVVGAFCTSFLIARLTLRRVTYIIPLIYMTGAVVLIFSVNFAMLMCGRFVQGVAIGLSSSALPTLVSELTTASDRSTKMMLFPLSITFGQLLGIVLAATCDTVLDEVAWRVTFGLTFAPAVVMLIITRVLVASKTQSNRLAHNTPSTAKLMANNNSQATLKGDSVVVEQEGKEDLVTRSILQDRTALKNLALGVSMHFLQQICGANAVMQYSASIIEMAIGKTSHTLWLATVPTAANFGTTCVALCIINRFSRRTLMFVSLVGMALSHVALAYAFTCVDEASPIGSICHESTTVPILLGALFTFLASFAIGMGCLPWTMCGELYAPEYRNLSMSISTAVNWTVNMTVALTFISYSHAVGIHYSFLTFAGIISAFTIVYVFVLPDTRLPRVEEAKI